MPERRPANLLEIRGLNVFYGRSHALQGVDLTLEHGVLSLVGRNGMGKTTLCKAIVGLTPAATGSIRFMGEELIGRTPAEIARLGLGYVPQGRRLWPSVTVDEPNRLAAVISGPVIMHTYLVVRPENSTISELTLWSSEPQVAWPVISDAQVLDAMTSPVCAAYIGSC